MSSAAARARDYRRRQTDGQLVLAVEVDVAEIIDLLRASDLLDRHADCYSRQELGQAVSAFLKISRHA